MSSFSNGTSRLPISSSLDDVDGLEAQVGQHLGLPGDLAVELRVEAFEKVLQDRDDLREHLVGGV